MKTIKVNELICPYCGAIYSEKEIDFEENKDNEMICKNCGKTYNYNVRIFYSSWKKED